MRIIHTADWHLGQEFHGFPRETEHTAFLAWLEDRLVEHRVDALLVSGDIFDSQNPPVSAQRQLYQFIGRIATRLPWLRVVITGGNHDSAGRLEAPGPLLDAFGVRVIGSLPRTAGGAIDPDRLLVPLDSADGGPGLLCIAMPFLRPADLPPTGGNDGVDEERDPLIEGVRSLYREAFLLAARRLRPGQRLVAMGHCYMTGGEISEMSERRILGGNQHALPADIFPEDVAYVALGHLHKAQSVGGRPHMRYSGSPLPLSVSERDYRHQVMLVEIGDGPVSLTPLIVPRTIPVLRIPDHGTASPEEVLARAASLDLPLPPSPDLMPYLEVAVVLSAPAPGLRRELDAALDGKPVRLARLTVSSDRRPGRDPAVPVPDLADLHPEDVFRRCWADRYSEPPPGDVLDSFRGLLEEIDSDGEGRV
ncbi:MAG: exonuclease subunit SbcD [Telmatospirillum sp.]|nr:exonuclease subunit SbcD [Telmatospirillum sp.]